MRDRLLLAVLVVGLVSAGPSAARELPAARISDREALQAWQTVFGMYRADYGHYPELSSIQAAAALARAEDYWVDPQTTDESGQPYRVVSRPGGFQVSTADGRLVRSGRRAVAKRPPAPVREKQVSKPRPVPPMPPSIATVGTSLMLTKSGNDIIWTWGGSGAAASGDSSADAQFRQVRTHFRDLPTPPNIFTWTSALVEDAGTSLRFFDVADDTDPGNKGGPLPPPPPVIDPNDPSTNLASLYVGGPGVIMGQNFSAIGANWICFGGGVCTQATTSTTTRLDYTVPAGAVSGPVYVVAENQNSAPETATVTLTNGAMLIRSIGFSLQDRSYWDAGKNTASSPSNSVFRVKYDPVAKTWAYENRATGQSRVYYCSTQTSPDGWLVCGLGTSSPTGGTRKVDTDNPASMLNNCINLGGTSGNVRGAAVDPNPGADPLRKLAYFAHASGSNWTIKKVGLDATGCTGVLDSNFGNRTWNWGAEVGMAVDPVTGDLYVSGKSVIYKIDATETVTQVKSGFSNVFSLDIAREGTSDPGFVLVGDNAAGKLSWFALDNTGAPAQQIKTATALRGASWGLGVFGESMDPAVPDNWIQKQVTCNDDTATGRMQPLLPSSLVAVTPTLPAKVWISSPDPTEPAPPGQKTIRPSYPAGVDPSTAEVIFNWGDGVDRQTCAWMGDPGKATTGYEPLPPSPQLLNCDQPYLATGGACDNQDPFVGAGNGSFTDTGLLNSCKVCGAAGNPCKFEFKITKRYAGDNYRVYLSAEINPSHYYAATPVFTAWKRIYIEKDRMYRGGGLLFEKFDPATCGADCNKIKLYQWTNVAPGDTIKVFDETGTSENATIAPGGVGGINADGSRTITLLGNLTNLYWATTNDGSNPPNPLFSNLHSGGVGVTVSATTPVGFFEPDLGNMTMPFYEAFIDVLDKDDGRSDLPYMAQEMFTGFGPAAYPSALGYLSQVWFKHFKPLGTGTPPDDQLQNWYHFTGVSQKQTSGAYSLATGDFTYIYVKSVEALNLPPDQARNLLRSFAEHECGHQFWLNYCTNLVNCNPPPQTRGHHDYRPWWLYSANPPGGCPNANRCLMDPGFEAPLTNGIDHFCVEDLLKGDSNCSGPPGTERRDTALRTRKDPE